MIRAWRSHTTLDVHTRPRSRRRGALISRSLLLFGVFLALASLYRDRIEQHKRWIISATAALAGAALGRPLASDSPEYLVMWLSPILAMLCIDLATRRRPHPVSLVAGALIIVAFFKESLFAAVPISRDIGSALLRPFL